LSVVENNLLHRVLLDIRRTLNAVPKLSPHLAWRLHPEDLIIVMEEARSYALKMEHPWLPAGEFYLLGVRIHPDEQAPRLTDG
jgi:hypothetical protein